MLWHVRHHEVVQDIGEIVERVGIGRDFESIQHAHAALYGELALLWVAIQYRAEVQRLHKALPIDGGR